MGYGKSGKARAAARSKRTTQKVYAITAEDRAILRAAFTEAIFEHVDWAAPAAVVSTPRARAHCHVLAKLLAMELREKVILKDVIKRLEGRDVVAEEGQEEASDRGGSGAPVECPDQAAQQAAEPDTGDRG